LLEVGSFEMFDVGVETYGESIEGSSWLSSCENPLHTHLKKFAKHVHMASYRVLTPFLLSSTL
jgi:hypothetical protein